MMVFLRLSWCVILCQAVLQIATTEDAQYSRDAFLKMEKTNAEGITHFLTPLCNAGQEDCSAFVETVTNLCSVPTEGTAVCRTDCAFALKSFHVKYGKPRNVRDVKKFIPDNCLPAEWKTVLTLRSEKTSRCRQGRFWQWHNSLHPWRNSHNRNTNPAVLLSTGGADSVYCVEPYGSKSNHLSSGSIFSVPCSSKYHSATNGKVWLFCSENGNVIESHENCKYEANPNDASAVMLRMSQEDFGKIISETEGYITQIADVLQNDNVKELSNLLRKVGSFLAPIGAAFQFVSIFVPTTSAEEERHKEVMEKLQQLETQNLRIINLIENIPNVFKKELFDAKIEEMVTKLIYLEKTLKSFAESKEPFLEPARDACKHSPARVFINGIDTIFILKSKPAIGNLFDFNQEKFSKGFLVPILGYVLRAQFAAIKCFGIVQNVTESQIESSAKIIKNEGDLVREKVMDFYNVQIVAYAMNSRLENDLNSIMIDLHHQYGAQVSEGIEAHFNKSYPFYVFGVAVFKDLEESHNIGVKNGKCVACVSSTEPGNFFKKYGSDLSSWQVFVSYRPLDRKFNPVWGYSMTGTIVNYYKKYGWDVYIQKVLDQASEDTKSFNGAVGVRLKNEFATSYNMDYGKTYMGKPHKYWVDFYFG